jgi:aminopeptidase N
MTRRTLLAVLLPLTGMLAQERPHPQPAAGQQSRPGSGPSGSRHDPHSFARPEEARVRGIALDLTIDFERKVLRGTARLAVDTRDVDAGRAARLILDTAGLDVTAVRGGDGKARAFSFGPADPLLGTPLTIALEPQPDMITLGANRDLDWIAIDYATRPDAAALQWLAPEQTAARKAPFLFTQGQAILTRSWIPLQDTPGVRVTFDATIRAPKDTTVVMAAQALPRDGDAWRFRMDQPIPPYLIALACGALESRDVGPRSRVWAEPPVVERAAKEFAQLERMIAAAESLYGPYAWERYDVLVLPPSFPFGGMENPRLTFATPTILAGDQSLVALIAHELAHSWSGNLVTNATWRDFWLNEGFTVYVENRIMERVYGTERAAMEAVIGLEGLKRELQDLPAKDQVLHIDLDGRNPDDAMTAVAYEKGALFLHMLERRFGRERFDRFLKQWFEQHRFRSVRTQEFLDFLRQELAGGDAQVLADLRVEEWVRRPGIPANAPVPHSDALAAADRERKAFLDGRPANDLATQGWVTHQWLHFLDGMPPAVAAERLAELDAAAQLTRSGNAEILCAWLVLATKHGYGAVAPRREQFLLEVGRRKYLKPLYEALARTDAGRREALAIYARARPRYHAVATRTLDALVGFKQ